MGRIAMKMWSLHWSKMQAKTTTCDQKKKKKLNVKEKI